MIRTSGLVKCLTFVGILGALAFGQSRGLVLPWVEWLVAAGIGLWLLWPQFWGVSPGHKELTSRIDLLVTQVADLREQGTGIINRVAQVEVQNGDIAAHAELALEETEVVGGRVERVRQATEALGARFDQLVEQVQSLGNRLDWLADHEQGVAERVDWLATQGASMFERIEQASTRIETILARPVRRPLPRRMRVRAPLNRRVAQPEAVEPLPQAVEPLPQAVEPMRQPVSIPAVPVTVTTYQHGHPTQERQVNLRIGGRRF
jgi:uncharacterized protein YoxC